MKKNLFRIILCVFVCFCFIERSNDAKNFLVKADSLWTIDGTTVLSYNGTSSKAVVPDGMTSIGEGAFEDNRTLIEVVLPDSVTTIGLRAFRGCSSLSVINLDKISFFGEMAFEATAIKAVTLNSDVPLGLFAYGKLNYVKLSENVTSIGNNAFYCCYQLSKVEMSNNVYSIGSQAFMSCKLLSDITLPKSLTSIGIKAFYETGVTEVDVPSGVSELPGLVFGECTSLKKITLHEGLKSIASNMMIDTLVTSITIPSSVEEIGWFAVTGNDYLKSIYVDKNNKHYASDNGVLYNADFTRIISVPFAYPESILVVHEGCIDSDERFASSLQNVVKIVLPSTFENIYYRAFYNSLKLEKVILPVGLKKIYAGAFSYCKLLQKVKIPATVTFMGDNETSSLWSGGVFTGCSMLKEVIIPSGVTSLASYCFQDCTSLEKVYIPNSVTTLGKMLFKGCSSLKEIVVETGNPNCYTEDGIYYETIEGIHYLSLYPSCKEGTSFTTPTGVTHLMDGCFDSCKNLSEVVISKDVTTFGTGVFANTTGLSKVTFLNDISTLPDSTFVYSSVNEVILPVTLKVIERRAFAFCKNLKTIDLPSGLLTISSMAFYDSGITSLVMPDTVTSIDQAFMNCKELTSIHLSTSLKSMNASSFNGTKIKEITIPDSMVVVPDYSFYNCQYLETVNLGKTITSFSMACFGNCPLLKTINIDPENKYIKEIDGILYNEDFTKLLFVNKTSDVSEIVLPSTLVEVPQGSFANDERVKVITIPGSVKTYGYKAFYNASFEKVIFSEGVEEVAGFLFASCYELKEVVFPTTLKTLGGAAFSDCIKLDNVVIPDGCSIASAFSLFKNCVSLTHVTLPTTATSIPQYMFVGCVGLNQLSIPDNVHKIEMNAFERCLSLTALIIPSSVEMLEVNAFKDSGVEDIFFMGNAPLFVASQYGTIYYPLTSNLYMDKSATGFKTANYKPYMSLYKVFSDGMFDSDMTFDVLNIGDNSLELRVYSLFPQQVKFYLVETDLSETLLYEGTSTSYIQTGLTGGNTYHFKVELTLTVNGKTYKSYKETLKTVNKSKEDMDCELFINQLNAIQSLDEYSIDEIQSIIDTYNELGEDKQLVIQAKTNYNEVYEFYVLKKAYVEDISKITTIQFKTVNTTLQVGESIKLDVIFPEGVVNTTVTYSSSRSGVASVSSSGDVCAISVGQATIQAVSLNGVETSIVITVVEVPSRNYTGLILTISGIIVCVGVTVALVILLKKRGKKNV